MKRGLSKAQHQELQRLQRLDFKLCSLPLPRHLPQATPGEMVVRYQGEHYDLYLVKDRRGRTLHRHCVFNKPVLANVI